MQGATLRRRAGRFLQVSVPCALGGWIGRADGEIAETMQGGWDNLVVVGVFSGNSSIGRQKD